MICPTLKEVITFSEVSFVQISKCSCGLEEHPTLNGQGISNLEVLLYWSLLVYIQCTCTLYIAHVHINAM